jgi:hypothetical protein
LLVIVLALFIGALVPSVTLAAGPSQSTEPGDLSTVVSGFLDLLIALAIGGGIAYLLQMIGPWRDWSSPLKPLIVILLTAILGGALTSLKVLATAELFAQAPEWGRAFISFIVVFVGSQLTYQKGFSPSFVMPAAVFDTKGK